MLVKLTDIKNPAKLGSHKQYWFLWPDGTFLVYHAIAKPYYKYLSEPGAHYKRWMRIYRVDLPEGTQICRYVQRGQTRIWILYCLTVVDGRASIVRVRSERGVPPWMNTPKAE